MILSWDGSYCLPFSWFSSLDLAYCCSFLIAFSSMKYLTWFLCLLWFLHIFLLPFMDHKDCWSFSCILTNVTEKLYSECSAFYLPLLVFFHFFLRFLTSGPWKYLNSLILSAIVYILWFNFISSVTFSRIEPEGKLVMGFRKASTASTSNQVC